jgi:hypothetical protein
MDTGRSMRAGLVRVASALMVAWAVVLPVASGCGGGSGSAVTGAGKVVPSGPLAGPFTAGSVTAAVDLLAANGI